MHSYLLPEKWEEDEFFYVESLSGYDYALQFDTDRLDEAIENFLALIALDIPVPN